MGLQDLTDKAQQTPSYYGQRSYQNDHPVKSIEGRFVNLVWKCEACGMKSTHLEDFDSEECEPSHL